MAVDLTRYYKTDILNLSRVLSQFIEISPGETPKQCVDINATGPAKALIRELGSGRGTVACLMGYKTIGEFQKAGPVFIRPSLTLCKALMDTELNFSVYDYHQPFPIIGFELPQEIMGPHSPSLVLVNQITQGAIFATFQSRVEKDVNYDVTIGDDSMTLEERVSDEWNGTTEEKKLTATVWRICLNLGMLAATRQTRIEPLDKKVQHHRARNDERLNVLAGRVCQEISFRDLIVYEKPERSKEIFAEGKPQKVQHRRGHWKQIRYGPQHSLTRRGWINDYYTKKETEVRENVNTPVVLR